MSNYNVIQSRTTAGSTPYKAAGSFLYLEKTDDFKDGLLITFKTFS